MHYFHTHRNIFIGLGISLAIISFFIWYSYRNIENAAKDSQTVNNTLQSLQAIEDLMDDMQDIETGQRGYIISGDIQFLEPYYSALQKLENDTTAVKLLYNLYPHRENELRRLLKLVREKIIFVNESVESVSKYGRASVYQRIQSGKGLEIMAEIRKIIIALENEDRLVLKSSNARREVMAGKTAKLFGILATIFLVFLTLFFLWIVVDLKRRGNNEKRISYLADMVEKSGEAIISVDSNFIIQSWNKGAAEAYGYSKEEAIGKKCRELLQGKRKEDDKKIVESFLDKSGYYAEEIEYVKKNGQSIYVLASYTLLKNRNNKESGYSIVHRDITEKRMSEQLLTEFNQKLNSQVQEKTTELKEALERFNIIATATNDVVWDADLRKGGSVWWNNNLFKKFGFTDKENLTSTSFWDDHLHPDDKKRVQEHINDVIIRKDVYTWSDEYRFKKADGTYLHIYDRSYVMRDEKGTAIRMIGSMADVTDLLQARQELNFSEEKYKTLVEQATDGIFLADASGKFIVTNPAASKISQYSKEELLKLTIFDIADKEDLKSHPFHFDELKEGKNVITERLMRNKQGDPVQVEVNARFLSDGRMLTFVRDITERKKAEETIKINEEKYRTLVEQAIDVIALFDASGKILDVNSGAVELLGYSKEELVKMSLSQILTSAELSENPVRYDVLQGGTSTIKQRLMRRKDGTEVLTEVRSQQLPDGLFLSVIRDLTDRIEAQKRIQAEKDLLDKLIDSLPGIFYLFDEKGRFIRWNKQMEIVSGYSGKEIAEMHPTHFFEGEGLIHITERILKVFSGGMSDAEADFITRDGNRIPYYFKATRLEIENRQLLIGTGIDVSALKEAQKELSVSEEKYRQLFTKSPLPMWVYETSTHKILDVNEAAVQHYGYSKKEFMESNIAGIGLKREQDKGLAESENHHPGIHNAGIWKHKIKNGTPIDVEINYHDILYNNKPGRLVVVVDVTEKLKNEEEIKRTSEQLRQLAGYLNNVREEERTHIAREIHDELGQHLTVLKMDISWLNKKIGPDATEQVKQKIKDLLEMLDGTVRTVRRIAADLRPSLLDDLGLVAAMEWQLEEFGKRSEIITVFTKTGPIEDVEEDIKTGLFRILQESLTNVARHAAAKEVTVNLHHTISCITLEITDDGKGYDKQAIAGTKKLGILGMNERAVMMGGTCETISAPGKGTSVIVKIPFNIKTLPL